MSNFIVNKNEVQYVELNIKKVDDQEIYECFFNGQNCKIKFDQRGKKCKFWIIAPDGINYMCKYDHKGTKTYENAGQFIMNGVLDQLGMEHAEYYVVNLKIDGKPHDAILTKNYRKETEKEVSGHSLTKKYLSWLYDNNYGKKGKNEHSVINYYTALRSMYYRNNMNWDNILNDMLKYCLMQNVFMMSDLHFYNLSFLYDETVGYESMRMTPIYDCGNICCLNLSASKISNINKSILNSHNKSVAIKNFTATKKMPMFGVYTNLSECIKESENSQEICRPKNERELSREELLAENLNLLNKFRNELANNIVKNVTLQNFYNDLKNVDFSKIVNDYNKISKNAVPEMCIELVKDIFKTNCNDFDETIKQEIERLASSDRAKYSY